MIFDEIEIILASQSPRRLQLLTESGFRVISMPTNIDETVPKEIKNRDAAKYLAMEKAKALSIQLKDNQYIIASDTIVLMDEIIYSKPEDRNDAIRILTQLQGNMHEVITGVCIIGLNTNIAFDAISKVWLAPMQLEEITYYIDKYQPYDKAGAYAVQEWIGYCKIEKIEGTYTNIMGLPMDRVYHELEKILTK
jgi:septum formation protein